MCRLLVMDKALNAKVEARLWIITTAAAISSLAPHLNSENVGSCMAEPAVRRVFPD